MRNLIDVYARAVGAWAQNVSTNALARTVRALDDMRAGQYDASKITKDVYEYWRDLADFRAQAAVGIIPVASLDISAWAGARTSNFVQVPVLPLAQLALTAVVNPATNTVLNGLELNQNQGENSARVMWVAANAGAAPAGADRHGLFQGAIFRVDTGELLATVYARTHLP